MGIHLGQVDHGSRLPLELVVDLEKPDGAATREVGVGRFPLVPFDGALPPRLALGAERAGEGYEAATSSPVDKNKQSEITYMHAVRSSNV